MPHAAAHPLPVSARLAWWGTAWMRGHAGPDDLLDGVLAGDVAHLVVGEPAGLLAALVTAREAGATSAGLALPVEGDPAGLGGPPAFNAAALEAGEAVVVGEIGLVPHRVGPTVEWTPFPARRRPLPDVGEADRALRTALLGSAEQLAALDVARWRPEIADELSNLRHRPVISAPPGTPARCVELAARGRQALDIADLALEDDGGALTAAEADRRRAALTPLARAGRHALVAACSPEVWPPE